MTANIQLMPTPIGQVVRRLRDSRLLTRAQLADSAGVSESVIQKLEASADYKPSRSTAVAIMRAIEKASPLSESDTDQYLESAGLAGLAPIARENARRAFASMESRPMKSELIAIGGQALDLAWTNVEEWLLPDQRPAVRACFDLMRQVGAEPTSKLLDAALTIAKPRADAPSFDINLHEPPTVGPDGRTEHVVRHYDREQAAPAKPQAAASPKQRKRA